MINTEKKQVIVYTGGGTAGHIFPGLAVLREMEKRTGPDVRHCWIGSDRGMDRKLLEDAGVEFYGIPSGKLRRYASMNNLADVFRVAAGFFHAFSLLRKLRPAVVFSKGGYVTVPVVLAARILRIPSISHESDLAPGLATRINSRFSRRILVSFRETLDRFPARRRDRVQVSGNPVRPELFSGDRSRGLRKAGEGPEPLILVLGGSQGARQINTLVARILPDLLKVCRVIHQHGHWDEPPTARPGYLPFDFIGDDLADYMAAADLVLCRAGASTLWELAALGKPSILLPLGKAGSRGDQIDNAGIFESRGASVVFFGDREADELRELVLGLLADGKRLKAMSEAARDIAGCNAGEYISTIIQKELEQYGRISDH